jgi:hypothetical protein
LWNSGSRNKNSISRFFFSLTARSGLSSTWPLQIIHASDTLAKALLAWGTIILFDLSCIASSIRLKSCAVLGFTAIGRVTFVLWPCLTGFSRRIPKNQINQRGIDN